MNIANLNMKVLYTILALVGSCSLSYAKTGIDFLMVGDYGWTYDMNNTHHVFNGMSKLIKQHLNGDRDDIDFIATMGDNVYLWTTDPPDEAFDTMMSAFDKDYLRDLPIYAVRGNHDCTYTDMYIEVNLTKRYPNWHMPDLFYAQEFNLNPSGSKKFGLMHVDSCLLSCTNYFYQYGNRSESDPR